MIIKYPLIASDCQNDDSCLSCPFVLDFRHFLDQRRKNQKESQILLSVSETQRISIIFLPAYDPSLTESCDDSCVTVSNVKSAAGLRCWYIDFLLSILVFVICRMDVVNAVTFTKSRSSIFKFSFVLFHRLCAVRFLSLCQICPTSAVW